MRRWLEWRRVLVLTGVYACLVSCADRPRSSQALDHSSTAPRASQAIPDAKALSGLESTLRGQLVSTDAVVLNDSAQLHIRVVAQALFVADSPDLAPGADEVLQPLAATLSAYPKTHVELRAYTDDLDSSPSALVLTQKRAEQVANYLTQHGVALERLQVHGEGHNAPIASNSSAEGRRANRRLEILISALSS